MGVDEDYDGGDGDESSLDPIPEEKNQHMSMPRGTKIESGYASIADDPDAMNFRAISEAMTAAGHRMNHSSARNYLLRGMRKFAEGLAEHYGVNMSPSEVENLARNPEFQDTIRELLIENAYAEETESD